MSAIIGALRVVLGADSAALEKGLKSAAASLGAFAGVAAGVSSELTKSLMRGIENVAGAIPRAITGFDELGKTAQKIGIPVEELSALKHAADLSGVGMESLQKAVGKLSKAMAEAAAKPTSDVANAFRALGVSATGADGSLKTSSQVMTEIAGKFEGLKDGAGKTAIAMALFGKSGADLIPLLNSGKVGLAEMIAEARQLGITIDTQTAKSAEAFNDNLTRLARVKDGIIVQLSARLLPALQSLSQRMIDAAKDTNLVERVSGTLVSIFEGVARAAIVVKDNIGLIGNALLVLGGIKVAGTLVHLGQVVLALASAMKVGAIMTGAFAAAKTLLTTIAGRSVAIFGGAALAVAAWTGKLSEMGQAAADVAKQLAEQFGASLENVLKTAGLNLDGLSFKFGELAKSPAPAAKALKDFNYAALGGKSAIDQFLESQKKSLAAQQAELQTTGLAAGAKERLRIILEGLAIAQQNSIPITDALRMKLEQAGSAAEQMALKLQGQQLVQQNLAPHEAFRQEMENNKQALEAFGATGEQVARVQAATAHKYGVSWQAAGQQMSSAFTEIASSFGRTNSSIVKAAQIFGAAQAFIATLVGQAEALKLPFPANLAAAAVIAAKGFALVASIKSQKIPSAATGGSFMVRGGRSLTDNQLVPMHLAAGERVDVTPADRAGGGGNRTITIEGIDDRKWFSGDRVRAFAERLIEYQRDGGRIVLAPA